MSAYMYDWLLQERAGERNNRKRNSSRKLRKRQRAIEAIEKSDKTSVLLKAHKWQSLHRARTGQGHGNAANVDTLRKDPWVSLVNGVFSQSRTSLNTISEEEGEFCSVSHFFERDLEQSIYR